MLRATLRTALAHKGRLLLSALAVVLGVAFVTGSLMLTNALDRTFIDIIEGSAQDVTVTKDPAVGTDLTTDPGDAAPLLIPNDVVTEVQGVEGVLAAEGTITRNGVYIIDSKDEVVGAVGPPALGLSWVENPDLAVATITQGKAPSAPDEVVVDDVTFPKIGVDLNDTVKLVTPTGEIERKLVGAFKFGDTGGLAGATLTAFPPKEAQELLAKPGEWTTVEVAVADGFSNEEVADSITQKLDNPDFAVKTRAQQVQEQSDALRSGLSFFNYIMVGFAVISLFVAAFLIYNTFNILVAQRGQELALMRAIGATRDQVLRSVLIEAVLMAIVAVIFGIGFGYLLALGLTALFGAVGLSLTAGVTITFDAVIWAAIVGLVVTLLSALIPAARASRIRPVAALREVGTSNEGIGKGRIIIGFILMAIAVGLILLGMGIEDAGPRAGMTALGALLLLISVVFVSPLLAVGLVRAFQPVLSTLGRTTGKIAGRNAARAPKRLATTASALTIGLGLVVSVTVITTSAKASIDSLIDDNFKAQFVVGTSTQQPFSPTIAEEIRQVDGVEYVISESGGPVEIDGKESSVTAVGGGPLNAAYAVNGVQGEFDELKDNQAVVSNDMAKDNNWSVGDKVEILFISGDKRTFEIVGQYEQSSLVTGLIISLDEFRDVGGGSQDTALLIILKPGADAAAVGKEIKDIAKANPLLQVLDQSELKQENADQLNQLLYLIYAMLALSVFIAALGVVNTLALSVIERTREIGLLRAVGATRSQIRSLVRWEAVIVSLLGAVLGIVVGVIAGFALQRALADVGIDVLGIPWVTLLVILILALIIGILAAVLPARRAAKLNMLRAIMSE